MRTELPGTPGAVLNIVIEILFEDLVRPDYTRPLNGTTYFAHDGSVDEAATYGRLID